MSVLCGDSTDKFNRHALSNHENMTKTSTSRNDILIVGLLVALINFARALRATKLQ